MLSFNIAQEIKTPGHLVHRCIEYEPKNLEVLGRQLVLAKPCRFDFSYSYDGVGIVSIQGQFSAVFHDNCARCGKSIDIELSLEFDEQFLRLGSAAAENVDIDLDMYTFNGEILDLSDFARDIILLNYPIAALCSPSCKGVCSGCGANLNIEECSCCITEEYQEELTEDEAIARGLAALQEKYSKK